MRLHHKHIIYRIWLAIPLPLSPQPSTHHSYAAKTLSTNYSRFHWPTRLPRFSQIYMPLYSALSKSAKAWNGGLIHQAFPSSHPQAVGEADYNTCTEGAQGLIKNEMPKSQKKHPDRSGIRPAMWRAVCMVSLPNTVLYSSGVCRRAEHLCFVKTDVVWAYSGGHWLNSYTAAYS